MPKTHLTDRAVLSLTGEDTLSLLQGLVTVDVDRLENQANIFGALLAPQGKVQFDFFLHKTENGVLIDIATDRAEDFLKRMKMYKLRSKVDIDDVSNAHHVVVAWSDHSTSPNAADARLIAMGTRMVSLELPDLDASPNDYHAHRVSLGVPEGGKDFAFDDIFPHDAMMDALAGVDFKKGCYVGQEVVSRVQHRSTARKRFFILSGDEAIEEDAPVMLDDKSVGMTGKPYGNRSLALLRSDKLDAKDTLTVNGKAVRHQQPLYFTDFLSQKA